MLRVIDERTLISGNVGLCRIGQLDINMKDKLAAAHKTIYSDEYLCSYKRNGQLETLGFKVIHPEEVDECIKRMHKRKRKKQILKYTPKFVIKTYHNIIKVLRLIK